MSDTPSSNSPSSQPHSSQSDRWLKVGTEPVGDFRIFALRKESWRDPRDGRDHTFSVLDTPDWVNVIAVTDDGELVLVRQHRTGVGALSLEIPGGMVDPGETARQAAERELMEETGYRAKQWTEIGRVRPNPAFHTNWCTTFLASGAEFDRPAELHGIEDIEVELYTRPDLDRLIREGEIDHALVIAAAYWAGIHDQSR